MASPREGGASRPGRRVLQVEETPRPINAPLLRPWGGGEEEAQVVGMEQVRQLICITFDCKGSLPGLGVTLSSGNLPGC